jgi:sortase A
MALAALIGAAALAMIGKAAAIHAKAVLAQLLLERAFAQSVTSGKPVKPWSWADTWPVARVAVPRLGLEAIVLAGGSGQALAFGPGHLEGTPLPGEPGTAVIAAHRDTHFAGIGDVRLGDEIAVTRADGAVIWFRVTATGIVPWDASGIDPQADGRNLVLATCWPLDATTPGPLRYLIKAQMIASQRSERGGLKGAGR